MPRLLTATTIAICILVSLLAGCGGSILRCSSNPCTRNLGEQSASSEPEVETEPEAVDGDEAPSH